MKKHWLVLLLLFTSTPLFAADQYAAVFSYQRIYDLVAQFQDIPPDQRDRLSFHARLQAESGDPITAYILRGGRKLDVSVNANGFLDMPMSLVLRGENPVVVTNQPEGTVRLWLAIVIEQPTGRRLAWQDLVDAVTQVNQVFLAKARTPADVTPQAAGVSFKFPAGSGARALVSTPAGELNLDADENGSLDLEIADFGEGNADAYVLLSEPATITYPWFGR